MNIADLFGTFQWAADTKELKSSHQGNKELLLLFLRLLDE